MRTYSCKTNKLQNVYTIGSDRGVSPSRNGKLTISKLNFIYYLFSLFSETVDNNEIIEPTVSEAMIMLKNYVYDRGFSVKVNLQSGGVSI